MDVRKQRQITFFSTQMVHDQALKSKVEDSRVLWTILFLASTSVYRS